MLTDRPDVPHTLLGRLKVILNPEVCVLLQIRISYIESENVFSFAVD